ncbi:MAG TPA: hypothetical protein VFJ43_00740, partial [Bacteroidia bacterium]|nr:hypothetical protein [Bacteroidia bacterium]
MKTLVIDKTETRKIIFWLTIFSIAMGFLETAVVVYMRQLYYPGGFAFPLVPVAPNIAVTEFWREAATIIMLLGVGIMAGKNGPQRLVFFLYAFAIWDFFYYVFLYVLLAWPQSPFTWDILFIIPVPWVGPVLCPCLVDITMILLMISTVHWQFKGKSGKLSYMEKIILISGSLIILTSFIWDYMNFVQAHHTGKSSFTLSHNKKLFSEGATYIPQEFSWMMFWCGQIMITGGVLLFTMRMRREGQS